MRTKGAVEDCLLFLIGSMGEVMVTAAIVVVVLKALGVPPVDAWSAWLVFFMLVFPVVFDLAAKACLALLVVWFGD